ncbi:hypothetical protein LI177_13990 [bacterium 210820-DFI.6.37]|nr:hypothetical protein [bacterium 210820-DFI.6.37]
MNLLVCVFLVCGILAVAFGIVSLVITGKKAEFAVVQDAYGNRISRSCSVARARAMVSQGEATLIRASYPVTIRLNEPRETTGRSS